MRKTTLGVVVLLAALMLAPFTFADPFLPGTVPLPPGGVVAPGNSTGVPAGTLLASETSSFTSTNGLLIGSVVSAVYRDTSGTLDFYYQLNNLSTSTDSINRGTFFDYFGTLTGVSTRTDGGTLAGTGFVFGSVLPVDANRSGTGDTIGFDFGPASAANIGPGTSSFVLVVGTNATNFGNGTASVIDGGVTTVAAFAPTTPEPGSMVLLGTGLIGLGGTLRRRKAK